MLRTISELVQAMPLLEGKVNLSTGTHKVNVVLHCALDGAITITWPTGVVATIDMLAGEDYAFTGSIAISSGLFHID